MRIIVGRYPPNFERIDAVFHTREKPVLYCFGDAIFNPMQIEVPPFLIAHESVHCERQGDQIEEWWDRYLADPAFRLQEELPAHAAEYACLRAHAPSRPARRAALAFSS